MKMLLSNPKCLNYSFKHHQGLNGFYILLKGPMTDYYTGQSGHKPRAREPITKWVEYFFVF